MNFPLKTNSHHDGLVDTLGFHPHRHHRLRRFILNWSQRQTLPDQRFQWGSSSHRPRAGSPKRRGRTWRGCRPAPCCWRRRSWWGWWWLSDGRTWSGSPGETEGTTGEIIGSGWCHKVKIERWWRLKCFMNCEFLITNNVLHWLLQLILYHSSHANLQSSSLLSF